MRKGDDGKAIKLLRQGLILGKDKGFINLYMWQQGVLETLLDKALQEGIEVTYVRELIQRNRLRLESSSGSEEWPYPVKIYTLGTFRLLLNEAPLSTASKAQRKPLQMLKILISLGRNEIREEQVTDLLWPESDGDAAHTVFTTTLLRLRRLVRSEKAVSLHEGRISLNPEYVWVDVFAFEQFISRAEEGIKTCMTSRSSDDFPEVMRLTDRAMNLYGGHFLQDDEEQPWSASLRERLRGKFIQFLITTGAFFEQSGKWKDAAKYYLKGLDTDDLIEEFYQRLMICYQNLGCRGEAVAIYQRCNKIVSAALGVKPSHETEKIYRTCVLKSE